MGLQPLIRAACEYDVVQEERLSGLRVEEKNAFEMPTKKKTEIKEKKKLNKNYTFCKTAVKNVIVCVSRFNIILDEYT